MLCDDPKVRIIATDPPVHEVEGVVVQFKDKDVQFTCIVENKPEKSDVSLAGEIYGLRGIRFGPRHRVD